MQPEQPPAGNSAAEPGLRLPHPADLIAALGLLTSLPIAAPEVRSTLFGRATPLFPLVGAAIGGTLIAIDVLARGVPTSLRLFLVVALWQATTHGALRRQSSLPISHGVIVSLIRLGALAAIAPPRYLALLFAPMLGSWSVVVLAVGARDAASSGRKLAPGVLFNEFALASLVTFAVVFSIADGLGILLVVIAAAVIVGLRVLLHQRFGGVSLRWLVLGAEMIEVLTLALLATLQT